jgi:hypothetical protein
MAIRRMGPLVALLLAGVANSPAAEPSFSGSWKLNMAKSQLTGQTFTLEKTPSGKFHFDSEGFAYDFDLTGKEFPTPDGGTTSWQAPDAATWEGVVRMNGKAVVSYRLVLKGDTLMSVMKVAKPDGGVVEETGTNARVSGGPGFLGKWKSTELKGAPVSLEIVTDASNHITVKYPEFQQSCAASFDGKDYVLMSAGAASKQTLAFEKAGANSFRMTTKLSGKPFYIDVLTLSADGKTLTDNGNSVSVSEPVKAVYDRQ